MHTYGQPLHMTPHISPINTVCQCQSMADLCLNSQFWAGAIQQYLSSFIPRFPVTQYCQQCTNCHNTPAPEADITFSGLYRGGVISADIIINRSPDPTSSLFRSSRELSDRRHCHSASTHTARQKYSLRRQEVLQQRIYISPYDRRCRSPLRPSDPGFGARSNSPRTCLRACRRRILCSGR